MSAYWEWEQEHFASYHPVLMRDCRDAWNAALVEAARQIAAVSERPENWLWDKLYLQGLGSAKIIVRRLKEKTE